MLETMPPKIPQACASVTPRELHFSDYSRSIILALRKIMAHMDKHSRGLMKHHDITVAQIIVLYEIFEFGPQTIKSLSQRVHLSEPTVVGVVDRLEEKGFVTRVRIEKDRRSFIIEITESAAQFVHESPRLLHNRLGERIEALSVKEKTKIASALETVAQLFSEDGKR